MTKNHIDFSDLNKSKKLTRDINIKQINKMRKTPLNNNVVDQTWNCKKIETMSKIRIRILFLGSTLWVKVLSGE